jgi:hypothetical protein
MTGTQVILNGSGKNHTEKSENGISGRAGKK